MNIFSKKVTPSQNIAFLSILAALNVIFVFISAFIPILSFLLIFVLPLLSALGWIFCQKKYFPLYAVATLGLSAIVLAFRLSDTLFYVIPSIITGLVFGLLIEKGVPSFLIIFIATLVQAGLTYALIPLLDFIFGTTLIESIISIFGLADFAYKEYLPPTFIFAISLIQIVISFMVLKEEMSKLNVDVTPKETPKMIIMIIQIVFLLLSIGFAFIYGPLSFLMMSFVVLFGIYLTILECSNKKIVILILTGINFLMLFFIFALLAKYIQKPLSILLVMSFFVIEDIIIFSNYCLENFHKKDKINTR